MAHGDGALKKQAAGLGEGKLFALVPEELCPALMLEGMDMLGDSRLRNMEKFCGFCIVHGLAYGQEGFHTEIQHRNHLAWLGY